MDKVPKIKWGDLEDDVLVHSGCTRHVGEKSEIKDNNMGDNHTAGIGKSTNKDGDMPKEEKQVVISEDVGLLSDRMTSLTIMEGSVEEKCKLINEIFPRDLLVSTADGELMCQNDDVIIRGHEYFDPSGEEAGNVLDPNSSTRSHLNSAIEIKKVSQGPFDKSEGGALDIPELPVSDQVGGVKGLTDPVVHQQSDSEVPITAIIEDGKVHEDGSSDTDLSKSQLISDLGEGESAESKERFRQRLWCFLFENLNRAVDELYLLCELECDVEQMKEATLVLEEAAADFKELKSRVEEFDQVKRSNSLQLKDGKSLNSSSDHQRAHALSWEVRRMASSPHRAEILSSSLEAFKKIQQDRANRHVARDIKSVESVSGVHCASSDLQMESTAGNDSTLSSGESGIKTRKQSEVPYFARGNSAAEKRNVETGRPSKTSLVENGHHPPGCSSTSNSFVSQVPLNNGPDAPVGGKGKREALSSVSEKEKPIPSKDKVLTESKVEKYPKSSDELSRHSSLTNKERERENSRAAPWKKMDAWKEKRNWEAILTSPMRGSSRVVSHSPGMSRKSVERARVLHDKLMSPEKKKKTALDMKREAEEKHARAMKIRSELENERVQRLQRTSEKLNRVNEWQAVRNMKLREGMFARHQRCESRYEAHLAQVVRRAGDESSKVNEVRFITSLNEENKKLMLRQKLQDSEMRRAEKLQVIRSKQKEDTAREEAVLERRKLLEAEKLQRLAEIQRKKEEAQVRREEERRASSAAREAKAVEQLRRKEERAKAQQEEAELLAQKLAERLSESEQRRKFYLEQIREKASMDFRDQSSPSLRRSLNKEVQVRTASTTSIEEYQVGCFSGVGGSSLGIGSTSLNHTLKRRIKKIRQRLMALKYEFIEPAVGAENVGIGYRAQMGAARAKIGRWLQDLQRLRQARKEGATSIGLIVGDMIKFLEGKESELHAARRAGLIDFIASALPASHTSKPEACQVTIYLLRLLKMVLSLPANRSYFVAQNFLPPIIPMLSAALENYIKIAASLNVPGSTNSLPSKVSFDKLESTSEVLEGFLWIATMIIGHKCSDERQLQMRDGLMVLVVLYQVIHRLRDLFALYDRPQVEGAPFPSSILFSLNLLVVLTSRSGSVSSIDWEACLSNTPVGNKIDETTVAETTEMSSAGSFDLITNSGSYKSSSPQETVVGILLHKPCTMHQESSSNDLAPSDVLNDQLLDEQCLNRGTEEPLVGSTDSGEKCTDTSDKLNNVYTTVDSSENEKGLTKQHPKPPLPQKNEKTVDVNGEYSQVTIEVGADSTKNEKEMGANLNQPLPLLVSSVAETGLISLLSLLTAVLLQANNRLSSDQGSYILPSNFEEVATGVLKVLNNLAFMDISLLQKMLARPDLRMEFFHLMSFLLSHCASKWKAASDQVGLLLLESLLLLGNFALFHPENQAVLRWGKSPTILHKVCDLPFVFFSDPELTPILAGTLMGACYGCEQNREVVQQELSLEMLLSLLKSCRQGSVTIQSEPSAADTTDDPSDSSQLIPDSRKFQGDLPVKFNRNTRSARALTVRGSVQISNSRVSKVKIQRDNRGTKTFDDWAIKHNLPASDASYNFMLYTRFPSRLFDRAEEFFSSGNLRI